MTRCESYPPCFGTIYFPTAPFQLRLAARDLLIEWYFRFQCRHQ